MTAAQPISEVPQPAPVPRLLVELPSRREVFLENLRDLFSPPKLPSLELQSAPAAFWPDVFVKRGLPWRRFFESGACHVVAGALLIGLARFFAMQPVAVLKPTFEHDQVIVYQPAEYLPPLDTRSAPAERTMKADPEFARQPIISVPPEAENRSQTVVTPPNVKLKRDVALPNIVAWSDKEERPRLDIPAVPLTPAAEITRIAPPMTAVVAPPPDAARLADRRNQAILQASVVAPPPDIRQSPALTYQALQPAVIAPPPRVEDASARSIGELNIGHSAVIAPAPRLAVSEQRAVLAGRSSGSLRAGMAPQVVAPPPSLSASGSAGSRGRVIALNLRPVVGAPPNPPAGNRRGSFAATPEGHAGASGAPGSTAGDASASKENGVGSRKNSSNLPAGLYVGNAAPAKTSPVAGNANVASNIVNPNLIANLRPPRITSDPKRAMQPESVAKLSEPERAVFGDRKFYSLTLNMPNLNSSAGSWVIRFAELNHDSGSRYSNHDAGASAADLSQPMATRKVDPAYPIQLMRENVRGTVILYAVIHADGTVGDVRVLRGVDERLDRYASEALARWQFQPATKNGTPVDVEATFQIPFRPSQAGTNF
jgi:TonB family protein